MKMCFSCILIEMFFGFFKIFVCTFFKSRSSYMGYGLFFSTFKVCPIIGASSAISTSPVPDLPLFPIPQAYFRLKQHQRLHGHYKINSFSLSW